jgi:hypothetical protein
LTPAESVSDKPKAEIYRKGTKAQNVLKHKSGISKVSAPGQFNLIKFREKELWS